MSKILIMFIVLNPVRYFLQLLEVCLSVNSSAINEKMEGCGNFDKFFNVD
jgi:hypothetical protein